MPALREGSVDLGQFPARSIKAFVNLNNQAGFVSRAFSGDFKRDAVREIPAHGCPVSEISLRLGMSEYCSE